jgi:uncharacterized membrane protein
LVIIVVAVAAFFVTIVAWFCALFIGRVSDGQQRFLTNALRLYGNTLAYSYFLVPRWPGITFSEKLNDQVSVDVDHVSLRRWSVFFRAVLLVPASLVGNALNFGAIPLLLVAWLWGVLTGREPRSIHQALALVLRYQLRLQAYSVLLTPTQPFQGFFGDGLETPLGTSNAPSTASTVGATFPPSVDPSSSARLSAVTASSGALTTRWFVSKATRALMVLTVVAGALLYFFVPRIENPLIVRLQDYFSRSAVTTSHSVIVNATQLFETSTRSCRGAYMLECQQRAATVASPRVGEQSALLLTNNVFVPTRALASVKSYESSIDSLVYELSIVQRPESLAQQTHVVRVEIPVTLAQLNHDFRVAEMKLGG